MRYYLTQKADAGSVPCSATSCKRQGPGQAPGPLFFGARRSPNSVRRNVFQRRMVHDDAQTTRIVLDELPGLVDGGDLAVLAGDVDLAHGGGAVAGDEDRGIDRLAAGPALQREAGVLRESGVAADEVGQRTRTGGAEGLRIDRQRRLEIIILI